MSGLDGTEAVSEDIDVVAARWFHRLDRAKGAEALETQRAFQGWLNASADHADAFARSTAAWHGLDEHAAAPEMMALRQAAIQDSRSAGLARWRPSRSLRPTYWPRAIAACLVAVVVGAVGYELLSGPHAQFYATTIGERHSVTLADNSRVDIDADSQISVDFSAERRLVHVIRGQAYFKVEKNRARPFVVESNGRSVIATGTEFDVETLDRGLRVTLVVGHVIVRHTSGPSPIPDADLKPGDELTDETGSPPRLLHLPSTLAETAWRDGKLLFDSEPLGDAATRVNRYSHQEVLPDAAVATLRISGAFDAGDTMAFVNAIKAYYPVDVVSEGPDRLRLVRRR